MVLLATVELAWLLGKDMLSPPLFLPVFIGIELLHTMKIDIEHRVIHLEAMLIVALIAVARKIVVLDKNELPEGTLLGIAAMVFALTLGYYLVRRSRLEIHDPEMERKG